MDSIIKHLVEITGHRDHDLLNISVISALCELTQAEYARVLDISYVGAQIFVQSQITIKKGKVIALSDPNSSDDKSDTIGKFPALEVGLAAKKNLIEGVNDEGKRVIWLPIWVGEK